MHKLRVFPLPQDSANWIDPEEEEEEEDIYTHYQSIFEPEYSSPELTFKSNNSVAVKDKRL